MRHRNHSARLYIGLRQICVVEEGGKAKVVDLFGNGPLLFSCGSLVVDHVQQDTAHFTPGDYAALSLQHQQQTHHPASPRLRNGVVNFEHGGFNDLFLQPEVQQALLHHLSQKLHGGLPVEVFVLVVRALFQEVVQDLSPLILHRQHDGRHAVVVQRVDVDRGPGLLVLQKLLHEGCLAEANGPVQHGGAPGVAAVDCLGTQLPNVLPHFLPVVVRSSLGNSLVNHHTTRQAHIVVYCSG
mmetsp:Transcript_10248/g.13989  ORF Transcript_10248/g.13989 Transcript_10248/m.13989 type:complete len:240 (+) Transcript_10248:1122-1841(+)